MKRRRSTADEIARRVRQATPPQPTERSRFTIRVVPGHSLGPIDWKNVEKVGFMEHERFIPQAELAGPQSPRSLWPKLLALFFFVIALAIFIRWVAS